MISNIISMVLHNEIIEYNFDANGGLVSPLSKENLHYIIIKQDMNPILSS